MTLNETFKALSSQHRLFIGVVLCVALGIPVLLIWSAQRTIEQDIGAQIVDDVAQDELRAVRQITHEKQLVAESRRLEVKILARAIGEELDKLDDEIQRWAIEVATLIDSERGVLLASVPGFATAYDVLLHTPRATLNDARAYRERVAKVSQTTFDTLGPSTYLPGDAVMSELADISKKVHEALMAYTVGRVQVESMLRAAETQQVHSGQAPSTPDGDPTQADTASLKRAIEEEKQRQAVEAAAAIAQREEEARMAAAQVLAAERAKQVEREGALEALRIKKEALQQAASDPQTQALFQPFLATGRNRVGIINNHKFTRSGPASLSDLNARQSLATVEQFAACGSGRRTECRHNDRPRWSYPVTDAEWEEMDRRFATFRELAPVWVELGLLRP